MKGFDTGRLGTPEREWHSLLEDSARRSGLDEPLLVVSPHPDDETLAAGGLLYRYAHSAVLLVTDGEAAGPAATLAQTRRMEMIAAMRILSGARVQRLAIPDGRVERYEAELERALEAAIHRFATIVAPFEADGHTDHDAVGRVCQRVARRHGKPLLRYLIWKWHQGRTSEFRARQFVRLSMTPAAQAAKRRAIACYGSQLAGGRYAVVPTHVLQYFGRPYEAFLQ